MDNQHLLVGDDDQDIRELLQDFLRKHGYDVSVAKDGAHAASQGEPKARASSPR